MLKVANRALRRAMQLFAGKRLPSYNNRVRHADLSKPLWERRGFRSKDDMLDTWRLERQKIGISAPGYDGTGNADFSIKSNLKSYLNNLLGRKSKAPSQSGLSQPSRRDELKHIYDRKLYGDGTRRSYGHMFDPSFSADVEKYVNRRVANDVNLKYLNTLARRHSTLNNSDMRSMIVKDDFSGLTPVRIAKGAEAGNRGHNASMQRLSMKLDREVSKGKLDRDTVEFLRSAFPAVADDYRPHSTVPLVVSFKSDKPFGTTNHVADAETTLSRMEEVDKAVEKLKQQGRELTADNISAEVYKTGIDPTELRVHAGDPYTQDEIQAMLSGYFGNRIDNNYESTFKLGDKNYPGVLGRHVGDSPELRWRAFNVGLSHIFDRKPATAAGMIPDNDMVLFKGTSMPIPRVIWRSSGESPDVADRISSAYKGALQSHIDAQFDKPIVDNTQFIAPPTVLGTVLDVPNSDKFLDGVNTWLTPNPVTATGYSKSNVDGSFFPVTDDEVRKLFGYTGPVTEADPAGVLNSLPVDKQKHIAHLISHYGDYSQTEKFRDTVNRNIAQMNAMAPRVAKSTPKSIIEALMDSEGKSSGLPENVRIYKHVNYMPHWNVLKGAMDL